MDNNPVNLPVVPMKLIEPYEGSSIPSSVPTYSDIFNANLAAGASRVEGFPTFPTGAMPKTGRFPTFYPGLDNEELYAQNQSGWNKAKNGIINFAGTTAATFLSGTIGTAYGAFQSANEGKFSSMYTNPITEGLNSWSNSLSDKYALYKTERERDGSWWEPSNLFTANFLWDNIIRNLGFSVGTIGAGFVWGGALKALGLTSKLTAMGTKMATAADDVIAGASKLPQIERLGAINAGLRQKIGQGLLNADRGIVATMGTAGEAGLEALNNSQQFRQTMIEEFTRIHGYTPGKEELEEIDRYATSVGNFSYWANVGLLTLTNYVQLPRMVGSSFRADKEVLNNVIFKEGKYISSLPEKGFGKFLYKAKNVSGLFFNKIEAFEEGSQYVVQSGTQNYFKKKQEGMNPSILDDGVLAGVRETLTSDEGLLNLTIGGLAGAIQTSGIPTLGRTGLIRERGITGYGGEEGKYRNEAISALNKSMIKDKIRESYSDVKAAEIIQKEREAAIRRGDMMESKDLEFDYAHTFISNRLKYNAKDAIKDELESLRTQASTADGFLKLQQEGIASPTDTAESFGRRLSNIQEHASNATELYDAAKIKYKGQINKKTGERIYSDRVIDKLVYAGAKIMDYDRRIPGVNAKLGIAGVNNTLEILDSIINKGIPNEQATKDAITAISSLDVIADKKSELYQDLADLIEMSLRRKNFIEEYDDIKKNPNKYTETRIEDLTEEEQNPKKETVIVRTKKGDQEIEIGEEYFLGRVVEYDKDGNEVYRAPRLKILKVSEDSKTITIQDNKGVRDIDASTLEDYKLGKVSETLSNKKAKFFMENWNTLFEFNFGKGNKQKGRLEYSHKDKVLLFKYKDKYGKIREIEVTGDQFIAKKGYAQAMITPVGKLTVEQQKTLDEFNAEKDDRTAKKREQRLKILTELFEELAAKQTTIENLISKKKSELTNIQNDLEKMREQIEAPQEADKRTKGFHFKPNTRKALDAALRLTRMKDQLEKEVEDLEAQKDQIGLTLSYITDMAQNIDIMPTDTREFINDFKDQILELEILSEETATQISSLHKLIDTIKSAIDNAIDFLSDIINDFEKKYPKVPRVLGNEWVAFLNANPNFLKKKPDYKDDLRELDDLVAQVEDVEITLNEEKLKELTDKVNVLQNSLNSFEKELAAKYAILDKFSRVAKAYDEQKRNEQILKDEAVIKSAVGTASKGVVHTKNTDPDEHFDPVARKANEFIWRATIGIMRGNKPHQIRANNFGFNLRKFKNRNSIKGTYITSKNEHLLGLTGLTDYIVEQAKLGDPDAIVEKDQIIALVMVDVSGETPILVNEKGQPIEGNPLESVVFQVFPKEELEWDEKYADKSGYKSMFRKETPEELKTKIKKWYKDFRTKVFASTKLSYHSIGASFGFPAYSQQVDEKGDIITKNGRPLLDYDTRTSVEDAGLVSEEDFDTEQLIYIPTLDENVVNGTTHYKSELGRLFLRLSNGDLPLQNRKHTKKESQTIFDVILQLAKNMTDPKIGLIRNGRITDECEPLISWLESVVYWHPSDDKTGYNSIFWKKDENGNFVLTLSGKDQTFPFTPQALQDNRNIIVGMLENMYMNVNNSKAKDLEGYTEITGVTSSGEIKTRRWLNYQTFLLSKKFIAEKEGTEGDGQVRSDIPLTTIMTPLEGDGVNRTAIYFFTEDNANEIETSVIEPKTVSAIKGKKAEPASTGKYKLDGETPNTFVGKTGKKILFTATEDGVITILKNDDLDSILEGTKAIVKKENPNLSEADLDKKARSNIENLLRSKIGIKQIVKKEEKEEDEDESYTIGEEQGKKVEKPVEKKEKIEEDAEEKASRILEEEDDDESYTIGEERKVIEAQTKKFEKEDWPKIEKWMKANFPNIPLYRVKNLIQSTNGSQAWGMFKAGAIYIYENAEVGTIYHEVFEGVWKMFASPEEQQSIIDEFKQRKGSFIDRPSGRKINYSDATSQEIKEQLAEEFRDYVHYKKIPPKPNEGRPFILKLFSDLVNIIKRFFFGDTASKVEEMFNNINTGFYKDKIPYQSNLAFATRGVIDIDEAFSTSEDELRVALNGKQKSDVINSMTYHTLFGLIDRDENIFNLADYITKNKKDLYDSLQTRILKDIKRTYGVDGKPLMINIILEWDNLIKRHEEYLKQYNIEFDENDELQIKNEDKIRESDYVDANKIDHLKKASAAMKMMLSTLLVKDSEGKNVKSTIGGPVLIPLNKVWVTLLSTLHDSSTVEEMMYKLHELGETNINYRSLYKRLTKRDWGYEINNKNSIDLSHITNQHSERLLSSFYSLFRKQNPEVKTLTIFDNGEISIGDTHLSTFAAQLRDDFVNNMIVAAKNGSKYFTYDSKKKTYSGKKDSISNINLSTVAALVNFLDEIGIKFNQTDVQTLSGSDATLFREAVAGIRRSITEGNEIATVSGKVLKLNNRLLDLGYIQAKITHPEFDSTFFNVNGERTQSFIGTNPASNLYDFLSQIDNFDESSLVGTPYEYLLTDSFSQGSNILKRMFGRSGKRKNTSESRSLLSVAYISGVDNIQRGRKKESAKLSQKERFVQELNLNVAGYYLNLVPGDASMEWAVYMGDAISEKRIKETMLDVYSLFKDYFISELDLVKESDLRASSMAKLPKNRRRNSKEMRFFKEILGETLHKKVIIDKASSEQVYATYESEINRAVAAFISKQNKKLQESLTEYGILQEDDNGNFIFNDINLDPSSTQKELDNRLTYLNVNYMSANIELHKLLYSDPYQYADELKRMKNFNSPRQALINNSPKMNSVFNRIYNKGFDKKDAGWTNFTRDYFRSTTYEDVSGILKDYPGYEDPWKETDGGGIITFGGLRQFRIRVGNWNDAEEAQYRHDMGYEELVRKGATEEELLQYNKANPKIQSAYTPIKPIVSGSQKSTDPFNKILLDKFALYPMSRRLADDINRAGGKSSSNLVSLYEKMRQEDIDYIVFENSRKVGANFTQPLYNKGGSLNMNPYSKESIINVPFSIMSVQSEVPSKESSFVTRGSQMTKLVTMDFMQAGIPVDFMPEEPSFTKRYKAWRSTKDKYTASPLYKEIKMNEKLLVALIEVGYENILKKLGIQETYNEEKGQKEYSISDRSPAGEAIRDEMLKREVSDNISDALQAFLDGKSVLEATPAYHQIRNIIYSIADKEVMSPKINGGMKVQIPTTAFESIKAEEVDINGKKGYVSDTLKFYEKDGKQVCQIMIGRWFESDMSDAELLDYFNNTEEGRKILSGVAFRIPTQKQNSIERFEIKQFLPSEFRDSVVVPSAIVQKTGSDFDIDKLTMYLKNIFKGKDGKPHLISYYGVGEKAKEQLRAIYDDVYRLDDKIDSASLELMKQGRYQQLFGDVALGTARSKVIERWTQRFKSWFADELVDGKLPVRRIEEMFMSRIESLNKRLDELTDDDYQEMLAQEQVDRWYKASLENRYVESLENLVSHPANYKRLITPNSADQLKKLGQFIASKTVGDSFDYENVGNMLDRTFMTRLRHAFVTGKYAIGIAAVNQTNHSLNQRQFIYIDPKRLANVSREDAIWLKDAIVRFDKYNKVNIDGIGDVATMSFITNADGQDISDIISQFIDGYVDISKGPWIMELGATPNVTSTWLFLAKIGVPIDTIAYFMNQPIVRDYLKSIEVAGYSWLFMADFVDEMKGKYKAGETTHMPTTIPSKGILKELVGKKLNDLTDQERVTQQFILDEFLKYAKMAEHMFHVTQGSNFDTANFNDPYLVYKKFKQLQKAQQSIISDVDSLLSNSFVGRLGNTIKDIRNALAQILVSDQKRVRSVIEKVLEPYVDMNERDFVKLAQKAVNDLFDYTVQTVGELNKDITKILIDKGGVAKQLSDLMEKINNNPLHPLHDNYIVGKDGILRIRLSQRSGDNVVNNVKIKGLENKAYNQNMIISAFREIKEYLKGKTNLYNNIVELAILQSGLSSSSISFTSVVPYEDFEKYYHSTLMKLNSTKNLERFADLHVFQRNNWANEDIVPQMRAAWVPTVNGKKYNPAMEFINPSSVKSAVKKGEIPPVMNVREGTKQANFDHIVYSWEKREELLPSNWRALYPKMSEFEAINKIKAEMRGRGDYSYINKGLFEKVRDNYGNPLETEYPNEEGIKVKQFVYKAINAWGDAQRANEFYDVEKQSVIDNGFIKVDGVDNNKIIALFRGQKYIESIIQEKKEEDWQNEDNNCPVPF